MSCISRASDFRLWTVPFPPALPPLFLDVPRVNDAGLPLRANTHSATYSTKMSPGKSLKFPGLFGRHTLSTNL